MKISEKLNDLNELISKNFSGIQDWVEKKRGSINWPIYHSLDMRLSHNKIVHVDSNLFPSGFHLLSENGIEKSINLFRNRLEANKVERLMIVMENFTRNTNYLNNIGALINISEKAIGNRTIVVSTEITEILNLHSESYGSFIVYPIQKIDSTIYVEIDGGRWIPDFILMNNDMTSGIPDILKDIDINIQPALKCGWHSRRKSDHFYNYNSLISELGSIFELPLWHIITLNSLCENINFRQMKGLESLKNKSHDLLLKIKKDYDYYQVHDLPYLFLKADRGTFVMGIMEVYNADEILNINKKSRHTLDKIKNGVANTEIFLQEGIRTIETLDDHPAENMIYSVDGEIVGEIIRYNQYKSNSDSLNSRGMDFIALERFDIGSGLGYIKWLVNKVANLSCII